MGTFRQGMLRQRVPGQRGFTLIELMVTISVAAIVLMLAIPSFESAINSNKLAGAANEMIASLQSARMEAMRRGRRTVVCLSANANAGDSATCAAGGINGWITFVDVNRNGAFDKGTDEFLRNTTVDQRVQVSGSVSSLTYRSDGFARTSAGALVNASLEMCIPTSQPAENLRRVNIGSGSRVSLEPIDNGGSCS